MRKRQSHDVQTFGAVLISNMQGLQYAGADLNDCAQLKRLNLCIASVVAKNSSPLVLHVGSCALPPKVSPKICQLGKQGFTSLALTHHRAVLGVRASIATGV